MTAHPHRGKRGQARKQWEAATAAASLIYRSMEARTTTEAAGLYELAETRLREAGLLELADSLYEIANDWLTDECAARELLDRVAEAAGRLEATYLEMGQ